MSAGLLDRRIRWTSALSSALAWDWRDQVKPNAGRYVLELVLVVGVPVGPIALQVGTEGDGWRSEPLPVVAGVLLPVGVHMPPGWDGRLRGRLLGAGSLSGAVWLGIRRSTVQR